MIDGKRVELAKLNVSCYLKDGLLSEKREFRKEIFSTYLRNSEESIDAAIFLKENRISSLWVIVCSYYSMFYIANAALYKKGYKAGNKIVHKVVLESLIAFVLSDLKLLENYEDAKEEALPLIGKKAEDIVESFGQELSKRSFLQYESTEEIKLSKADTSIARAKAFIHEMKKLVFQKV